MPPGTLNNVGLDFEVFQQEVGWVGVIGKDPSHFGCGKNNHIGFVGCHPLINRASIEEIKLLA